LSKRPPRNGEILEKKQNTLLVDGNALFKTGFFGAKDAYNSNGEHIGGVYQFLTTLRKILSEDLYHRVYVFWDGNFSGKLRYEIYEPYKSARGKDYKNGTQPIDQSELKQRKMVWDYLNEMYIRQLKHEVIEGDDYIASYCLGIKKNEKITIITNDRDMSQLISENIKIYFCDLKEYVGIGNYNKFFKHHQSNSVLLKTMIGDVSDSIKGIKGLGESTLLTHFPFIKTRKTTLHEIIHEAKKIQSERALKKLKPLLALDNIINKVTDGVQGTNIYEINEKLVNLKKPMVTKGGLNDLKLLIEGTLNSTGRELKTVLKMMKDDGLEDIIGPHRYPEYLIPFKELISRENNNNNN
jgi:5'-3' exonuclease